MYTSEDYMKKLCLFPLLFLLFGCRHKATGPNNFPLIVAQDDLKNIRQRIKDDRVAVQKPAGITKQERDNLQQILITTSDAHYYELRNRLLNGRNAVSFAGEVTGTTLSAVSALVSGVDLKSILSTTSSLVQSTKVSLDKNFFAEQTTAALVTTMDTLRATQKLVINHKRDSDIDAYGLEEALGDALLYDDAGTVHTALLSVSATAAQQKGDVEASLNDQALHKDVTLKTPAPTPAPTTSPIAPLLNSSPDTSVPPK